MELLAYGLGFAEAIFLGHGFRKSSINFGFRKRMRRVWGGILRLLYPFSFGEIRGGDALIHYMAIWNKTQWNINMFFMPRAIFQDDHKKIVERLKQARLEAGLGQIEVAEKLGRTQSYLSKIESGQRRFDVLQLKEFAKIYKKTLDYFVR